MAVVHIPLHDCRARGVQKKQEKPPALSSFDGGWVRQAAVLTKPYVFTNPPEVEVTGASVP
jgi:hypothetical protein